jgi:hypothetical protein
VIRHFAGKDITPENGAELLFRYLPQMIDATRSLRVPEHEREDVLPDGRRVRHRRWTSWTERIVIEDTDAYAQRLHRQLEARAPDAWSERDEADLQAYAANHRAAQSRLGEDFFFMAGCPGSTGLHALMHDIGVEQFTYLLYDHPDVVSAYLEWHTERAVTRLRHLAPDAGIEAVMLGEDIAWKNGTLLSPQWLDEQFIPRLARIVAACHEKGIKVMFHSDGNLEAVLPGLVDAGIDMLNPIEILAGMDPGKIHRRYPHLILVGAVDVSQLLPLGTPQQVAETVRRTIEETEGKIMIGSSTELNNEVPLANFLAMREAVLTYEL